MDGAEDPDMWTVFLCTFLALLLWLQIMKRKRKIEDVKEDSSTTPAIHITTTDPIARSVISLSIYIMSRVT